MSASARPGRARGPLVVFLVLLLTLIVALVSTWLARKIVRHDAAQPSGSESSLVEDAAPMLVVPRSTEPAGAGAAARVEAPELESAPAAATAGSVDPVGCVVWGYLLEAEGKTPIPASDSPSVMFTDDLGNRQFARAGGDGAWSMTGLATGHWYLYASAQERKPQELVLDLRRDQPRVRQDFHLRPQPTVKVRLLAPDGRPFWEALTSEQSGQLALQTLAVATREPPGEQFTEVRGSLNNPFGVGQWWQNGMMGVQLPGEFWGVVRLDEDPPVWLSLVVYHDVVETQRIEPHQDAATFTLDPATLAERFGGVELQVVDERGDPLSGAGVGLRPKGGFERPTLADDEGRVRIEGRPSGLYDLSVQAEGKATLTREINVPRARVTDLGTVSLSDAVALRGHVLDADGNGSEAELSVYPLPAPGTAPALQYIRYGSRADGTLEIAGLGPGRWLLQAKDRQRGRVDGHAAEQMSPNVIVDTRNGPVEDLVVRLQRTSCVVARWNGELPAGLRIRFLDVDGQWRQTGAFFSSAPTRVDLLPGSWRVVATDSGSAVLDERTFTLGEDDLVLDLGPGR